MGEKRLFVYVLLLQFLSRPGVLDLLLALGFQKKVSKLTLNKLGKRTEEGEREINE